MGIFFLKFKSCFCSRKNKTHAYDGDELSKDECNKAANQYQVKGLKEQDEYSSIKDPKRSSKKLSMSTSGQMELNSSCNLKIGFLEESVPSTDSNQRGLVDESVALLARTDSYQDMLSMVCFLSMEGEHLSVTSIEEFIKESGKEIQEEKENDDMRDVFSFFDADQNGSISASDLHTTLLNMGENASEEECRLMIQLQAVSRTNGATTIR